MPVLTIPLVILAAIAALLPWWLLWRAISAGIRRFRPQRLERFRGVPLTRPGNPAAGTLIIVVTALVVGLWLIFTRPLWQGYAADAWEYRNQGSRAANLISAELMATGQPLGRARIGHGYVIYGIGRAAGGTDANLAFYWRGRPTEPGPTDPVETAIADVPGGRYALTYNRGLAAEPLTAIQTAFGRVVEAEELPARRVGVDVPVLLRSVPAYWQGYFGLLDTAEGILRFAAGLPVMPPLYLVGLVVGGLPGS